MKIKNFIITVFAILILFTSSVYSKNINVELISYEEKEDILEPENEQSSKLGLEGSFNLLLLVGVIGGVLLIGFWRPYISFEIYPIMFSSPLFNSSFSGSSSSSSSPSSITLAFSIIFE